MFSFAFQVQTIIPNDNQSSACNADVSHCGSYAAVEVEMQSVVCLFSVFLTSAVNFAR